MSKTSDELLAEIRDGSADKRSEGRGSYSDYSAAC